MKLVLLFGLCLLAARSSLAQVPAGIVSGVVRDQAGAAIAGVEVHAISRTTGHVRRTATGQLGEYSIPALDPLEERDLANVLPATVADMRARLSDLAAETTGQPAGRAAIAPETLRGLAALGYVSPGRAAVTIPPGEGGADPKDQIRLFNRLRARALR